MIACDDSNPGVWRIENVWGDGRALLVGLGAVLGRCWVLDVEVDNVGDAASLGWRVWGIARDDSTARVWGVGAGVQNSGALPPWFVCRFMGERVLEVGSDIVSGGW